MNKYLISVVGTTAIGKTNLSIQLAKHFNTDIISSDSRQFYKEMNIGTAVPSEYELSQAKHHFIQNHSIFEDYSVGDFEREALSKINELFQKLNVIIMVGGSGLYTNAVIDGLDYFPDVSPTIRQDLNAQLLTKGIEELQHQLKELDPTSFNTIEIENPHRLIRALEICIGTGKTYSSFKNKQKDKRIFKSIKIGLTADREIIYNRINKRVDLMIENGLVKEAENLFEHKKLNALQTVGYRELFQYFEGNCSLEEAISEIKKNTRRFAKRQITWNKKDESIHWFNFETPIVEITSSIEKILSFE